MHHLPVQQLLGSWQSPEFLLGGWPSQQALQYPRALGRLRAWEASFPHTPVQADLLPRRGIFRGHTHPSRYVRNWRHLPTGPLEHSARNLILP